jgi:hypothetical protein
VDLFDEVLWCCHATNFFTLLQSEGQDNRICRIDGMK